MVEKNKNVVTEKNMTSDPKTINVTYQVDTLKGKDSVRAYYKPSDNTITSNYYTDNSGRDNAYNQSKAIITHEAQHQSNASKGLYDYYVSPKQAYKLQMYNEISANIASIISLRTDYLKYLEAKKQGKADEMVNPILPKMKKNKEGKRVLVESPIIADYKLAVLKEEIKPGSDNPEDFDKEMSFIINETQKNWEDMYAKSYNEQCLHSAIYRSDIRGLFSAHHNTNYEKAKKAALTIGGIDFTKYQEKEVKIPEKATLILRCLYAGYNKMNSTFIAKFIPNMKREENKTVTSKFRKWSDKDGSRVSEVQTMEIYDMNQSLIERPTGNEDDLMAQEETKTQMKKDFSVASSALKQMQDKVSVSYKEAEQDNENAAKDTQVQNKVIKAYKDAKSY